MSRINSRLGHIPEERWSWSVWFIAGVFLVMILKLWYLQIYRGDFYADAAKRNHLRKIVIAPPRGSIYDRNGKPILTNSDYYDLVYVPQYVADKDKTLNIIASILHIDKGFFEAQIERVKGGPRFMPITLKRNLSLHEVSLIKHYQIFTPGIEVTLVPRREYREDTPPHLIGYLSEIDPAQIDKLNVGASEDNAYFPGDLVGKAGLEAKWEEALRGTRGYRLVQVDTFGRESNIAGQNWNYPTTPAKPGNDLVLTIDRDIQKATNDAFLGKNGAVITLNPQTGEIYSMVSSPSVGPDVYQKGMSAEKWRAYNSDPFRPMFDKTTGGEFPPGSIYKAVLALAGLQEGVVTPEKTFFCNGSFEIGGQVFHCHERKGHGTVDLATALMRSCDVYFYQTGLALGVDRIAKYARSLGLGERLGLGLNFERPGLIPTTQWKKDTFKTPWTVGETPSISIGQGANLLTPLQMLSLYSTIANSGHIWKPFLVKRVMNPRGKILFEAKPEMLNKTSEISDKNFALVRSALEGVVMNDRGTGKSARVPEVTVAGKTGSVQVVSLKRNRNQTNVAMKWKEHAIFAAFSPTENAEIAVIVVSENDSVGGGGASAAPVAGKILSAYWEGKKAKPIKVATTDEDKDGTR